MPPGAENGRMGDYVFNQEGETAFAVLDSLCVYEHDIDTVYEALDQIITQIMENSSAHPVAATEEIIDKLPREVLEEGCAYIPLLNGFSSRI